MSEASLVWGSPQWWGGAGALLALAAVVLLWSYGRARAGGGVRAACAALKGLGFAALALSLVEPLLTGSKAKPGANAFAVLADDSRSLRIGDAGAAQTRGDWAKGLLRHDAPWRARLAQDFDVRDYAFDTHLRAADGFEGLAFDGDGTALGPSLEALARRFRGLPLAGVLLVSDGNRTDAGPLDVAALPPVYPVVPPAGGAARDIGVRSVSVSQTNFESAPVVVRADVAAAGFRGERVAAAVFDEAGKELARQEAVAGDDSGPPSGFRFQFRPDRKGVAFYEVRASAATPGAAAEQTTANNGRLVVSDTGGGPYRILYVGGRPNWEFKFLRRALADDDQIELVGLIRIARRQPKFDFRDARARAGSPLFEGFDRPDAETAERSDQPVLIRLGTRDEVELRDGFPKTAADLYAYHAVVLDDLEAAFFTGDQLALLRDFVAQRGGGLLMLGGPDAFAEGRYDRTPVGDLLPFYLDRPAAGAATAGGSYRLALTREGWLQPWVRTRATEGEERQRLAAAAPAKALSRVGGVKPGASVLAEVRDDDGALAPALAAQPFGKGHVGALLIGDLWRSALGREPAAAADLGRSWRQTARWLVGDVPGRVEVAARAKPGSAAPAVELTVRVRDAEYRPLDDARVAVRVTAPGGETLSLEAEPDGREPGAYTATYVTKRPGAYRFRAEATAPDGTALGGREAGWAAQPSADEFARLTPDRAYLEDLAAKTGGEVVEADRLNAFAATLAARAAPVAEPWTSPLWHHPLYFLFALACLTAEWGLRRLHGLA